MEVAKSLLYLFVHKPPYQTKVMCCNSVFCCSSLCMNYHTVVHVRVGLAQAHLNNDILLLLH